MPGQSVRDYRHPKLICDAHADLQVDVFLLCQIDAQRYFIKVPHMQELDIIANDSVCKVILIGLQVDKASRRQANNQPDAK